MKKNILILITIVITLLISSCSFFNPQYEKPKIATPKFWNDQDKNIEKTKDWDLTNMAWWRRFNDPVLNNLVTIAL